MVALFTPSGFHTHGRLTAYPIICTVVRLGLVLLLACLAKGAFAVSWNDRPALDTWTVTGGAVSIACPANSDCSEEVEDNGFLQRKVTDEFGNSFYQHVLTEPGASGEPYSAANDPFSANSLRFHDEHIIRTGISTLNTGSGDRERRATQVVSKTFIAESEIVDSVEDRFFQINGTNYSGGGSGSWGNWAVQEISQIDWNGVDPVELMNTRIEYSGAAQFGMGVGGLVGIDMAVSQTIDLGDGGLQGFAYQADISSSSGTRPSHTPDPLNPLLPGGTNGGDVTWGTGGGGFDSIRTVWVGQYNPAVLASPEFGMTIFRIQGNGGPDQETKLVSLEAANPPGPWHPDLLAQNGYFSTPDLFASRSVVTPTVWATPAGLVGTKPHETPAVGTGGNGPPIPLGGWTVSNGDIVLNESCPLGAVCGMPVTSKGFMTREVIIAGITYIQTIITEKAATGNPNAEAIFDTALADFQTNGYLAFTDETFVRKGGGQGLSGRNQHAEVTTVEVNNPFPTFYSWDPFTYDTRINVGWAQGGAADPVLTLSQRLDSYNPNNAGVPSKVLQNSFDMAMLSSGAKDYTMISSHGYNTHYSRTIEGGFVDAGHVPDPFNPLLPDLGTAWATNITGTGDVANGGWDYRTPTNGGDISWSAGDALNVTWVGSNYRTPGGEIHQSATSFTNQTTGERTALINRSVMDYIPGVGRKPITPDGLPWIDPFATPTLSNTPTAIQHPLP